MLRAAVEEPLAVAFRRAEEHYHQGRYGEALEAYRALVERRLDRRLAGGKPWEQADLVLIQRLSELCELGGYSRAAELLLAAAIEINRRAGDRYGADFMAVQRAQVLFGQDRLEDAFAQLVEMAPGLGELERIEFSPAGLERWEAGLSWPRTDRGDRQVLLAPLYLVMGRLLAADGRYAPALACFERGLVHGRDGAPYLARQAALQLRLAAAEALLEKGELDAAGERLAALRSTLDGDRFPGLYAGALELKGQLGHLRGELGEAFAAFDEVRRFCARHGFHHASRTARLNLAEVLVPLNQTVEAERLAGEVRVEAARAGEIVQQARAEYLLALSQVRRQAFHEVEPAAAAVHEVRQGGAAAGEEEEPAPAARPLDLPPPGNFLAFFERRTQAFRWYRQAGNPAAAGQILEQMEVIFAGTDSALVAARLETLRGDLALARGDLAAAEERLRSAAAGLRDLGLRPELREALLLLADCRALAGDEAAALSLRREAEEILAAAAGSLAEEHQGQYLIDKWTATEEHLAAELDHLSELKLAALAGPRLLRPWRRWRLLRRLDAFLARLEALRGSDVVRVVGGAPTAEDGAGPARSAEPAPSARPRPAGTSRSLLRRLLTHPWRRATFGFFSLPDRTLIVRATWLGLDFAVVPLPRVALRHQVERWYGALEWAGEARNLKPDELAGKLEATGTLWRRVGDELAAALLPPQVLGRLPRRVRALTLVPDDVLHGFPFAALSHDGEFLGERYRLTADHRAAGCRARRRPPAGGQALLVGVARGTPGLRPLPGARPEVEAIAAWAAERGFDPSPGPLFDDAATRPALLARLPEAALAHIACHGDYAPGHPEQTGLVLVPRPGETELLSLRDLAGLSLPHLRHVTLSSCWAADNFVRSPRLVLSLPEVLRRGGAGSVLACLWEVDDRVAAAFMRSFYRHLAEHPRDEALRRARAACRANELGVPGIDTSHPYYWAGFNLYGEPGRLRFRRRR